jgi:hypothetical protein
MYELLNEVIKLQYQSLGVIRTFCLLVSDVEIEVVVQSLHAEGQA